MVSHCIFVYILGEYVVFHVKMTQLIEYFDWVIISKKIILNRGREFSERIFSYTYTFRDTGGPRTQTLFKKEIFEFFLRIRICLQT